MPVIGTPAAEAASHDCWTAMDTSYAAMDCESESESHDADLAPSERGPPTICPGVGRPGGRCVGCKDAAKTAAACSAKSGFSPGFGVDGGENLRGTGGPSQRNCLRPRRECSQDCPVRVAKGTRDCQVMRDKRCALLLSCSFVLAKPSRTVESAATYVGEGDDGVGGSAVSRQTRWVVSLRPSAAARTSISSSAAESAVTVSEPSGWLR